MSSEDFILKIFMVVAIALTIYTIFTTNKRSHKVFEKVGKAFERRKDFWYNPELEMGVKFVKGEDGRHTPIAVDEYGVQTVCSSERLSLMVDMIVKYHEGKEL